MWHGGAIQFFSPIGEPRHLAIGEHGGETGEAMPVTVEDGVDGRLLAAKNGGEHAVVALGFWGMQFDLVLVSCEAPARFDKRRRWHGIRTATRS